MRGVYQWMIGLALCAQSWGQYAEMEPFLAKYCVECHGPDRVEGGIRLNDLGKVDAEMWIQIHEQLDYGDMPPAKASQPPEDVLEKMTAMADAISRDERFTIATGYRRLNKREYRNTVNDLLGLSGEYYDPAHAVFKDDIEEGFDTNSMSLQMSSEQLIEYLRSASESVQQALFTTELEVPASQARSFSDGALAVTGTFSRPGRGGKPASIMSSKGLCYPKGYGEMITTAGNYEISFQLAGDNPLADKLPKNDTFIAELRIKKKGSDQLHSTYTFQRGETPSYEATVWLEHGAMPYLRYKNGSGKPRATVRASIRRRQPVKDLSDLPRMKVSGIQMEGPLAPTWPPSSYQTTFSMTEMPDFTSQLARRRALENFLMRAYRERVSSAEVSRYEQFLEEQHRITGDWVLAFRRTLTVIMASPEFLYIREDLGKLDGFELASRLSYFLWSSMPDLELFRAANAESLLEDATYRAQLSRMMDDPRVERFVEDFAVQWLSLDQLGTMPPDPEDAEYKLYYQARLQPAMRQETLGFFRHVFMENRPLTDFIDSDYVIVNEALAGLYDIPYKGDGGFQRVELPRNSVRGGLLGQASIHAITSNGVETLPVERGMWVLDELMGTPPPPPPESVPAIVPDLNHVNTPRDLLKVHREDPACYACHQYIDPPGLALESFDLIGRYRTHYTKTSPVEPHGAFMGAQFDDIRGFKKALLRQKKSFVYNFTVKLTEYAKGRKLNQNDHDLVKELVKDAEGYNYRFKELFAAVLMSDLMLYR